MSINERIIQAITPLVPTCVPDEYDGDEREYCTFQYFEMPDIFADGFPDAVRYQVQLHWYLPAGQNPIDKKREIRRAVWVAGGTYPSTENVSDADGQHLVFEFQMEDGGT